MLIAALIFGAIGWAYGSYFTSESCNEYYKNQIEIECKSTILDAGLQTDTTDASTLSEKVYSQMTDEIVGGEK